MSFASAEKLEGGTKAIPDILIAGLSAVVPDAYEPDNSWMNSNVIILNDQRPHPKLPDYKPIQVHNFHAAGDEDWVQFFILEGEIYKISVDSPGERCDAVIGIYDMDGQTLIKEADDTFAGQKEYVEWECETTGLYYARIRQYDPQIFGEGTEYQLSLTQPYMTFNGFIFGTVTPPVEATLSTEYSSTCAVNGEFFMPHIAGDFILKAVADGCIDFSVPVTVPETEDVTVPIILDCSQQTGTLKVTLAPQSVIDAGAGWRVDCGIWHESKTELSGLAPGGHAVQFKQLAGWDTPPDQTVNIVSGQTKEVSAIYWKAGDSCLAVDGSLNILVPCAEYAGNRYRYTLFYSPNSCPGLCWKLGDFGLAGEEVVDCLPIGSDLSMPVSCADYNGTQFRFILGFYPNPNDATGLYWQIDLDTFSSK